MQAVDKGFSLMYTSQGYIKLMELRNRVQANSLLEAEEQDRPPLFKGG